MTLQHLVATLLFALMSMMSEASTPSATLEGQWLLSSEDGETFDLMLSYRESSSHGNWNEHNTRTITRDSLHSFDSTAFSSAGANVEFELRRDAGSFHCEGWSKGSRASGHFVFSPDSGFASELDRLGFGKPTTRELLSLALSNTGMDLVREIGASKFDGVTTAQVVRATHHGVTAEYIRGLRNLGYQPDTLDAAVRMRDHGVTLQFIRGMSDAGYGDIDAHRLVRLRDHGVTPEFAREIKAAGLGDVSPEELVRLRDHGVTARYVKEIRKAGLTNVSAAEVVRLRDRGITASDISSLKK